MFYDISIILKKEFASYFRTKLAYFIMSFYAVLSVITAFYSGYYFDINNISIFSLFYFQPEIFIILAPALTMKLWADERRFGTLELILSQPLSYTSLVVGKFLSAWLFCGLLLLLTMPLWLTTSFFMQTDNLNIMNNYFSCFLVSGALCSIGCVVSSFNTNPIVAYIMSVFVVWFLKLSNLDYVIKYANISNELVIRISNSLSFDKHFENMISGELSLNNIIYFLTIMIFSLWLNVVSIDYKRG